MDDAAKLQEAYPGKNTEHIAEQQSRVVEHWNALQERAMSRKEELLASSQLHQFLADVCIKPLFLYS